MATIIPNQDFKHGGDLYKKGESYEVSDEEAQYFKDAGWVGERVDAASAVVTLDVHDVYLGHKAEVN